MEDKFSLVNKTRGRLPLLPFEAIKNDILGKNYSLSVAYISISKIREINKSWRNKDKATNVLSFSLSAHAGEILICPSIVKTETKKFGKSFKELLGFLFIHGLLHLKGMQHSSRMEEAEKIYDKKYFYRNRHGVNDNENSGRRISKGRRKS